VFPAFQQRDMLEYPAKHAHYAWTGNEEAVQHPKARRIE